jgi:hypothetical protein
VSTKLKVKPDDKFEYFECVPAPEDMPEAAFEDFDEFPEDLEPV